MFGGSKRSDTRRGTASPNRDNREEVERGEKGAIDEKKEGGADIGALGGGKEEKEENIIDINELLARCVQGLGRPLRVRIMQSIELRTSVEVLYHLTDLLSFYEETFKGLACTENAVR